MLGPQDVSMWLKSVICCETDQKARSYMDPVKNAAGASENTIKTNQQESIP